MSHGSRVGRWLLAGFVVLALAPPAQALGASSPSIVGFYRNAAVPVQLSGATSVATSGNYAYTTAYFAGVLTAIDITNPSAPTFAGMSATDPAVIGADTVNISGGFAYVASKNSNASATNNDNGDGNSLSVFDLTTTPGTPILKGKIQDVNHLFGAYGIAVGTFSGRTYAFVAAQGLLLAPQPQAPDTSTGSFTVIDVTNPAAPTYVTSIDNGTLGTNALQHADSVAISGHYAFVTAAYADRMTVIDISNPAAPAIVASLHDPVNLPGPSDVTVSGNYAYVTGQTTPGRITVVDVSNPVSPQIVGSVSDPALGGAYRVRVLGNFAYVSGVVAASVTAVDISNPASPRVAGSIANGSFLNSTTGLDVDPAHFDVVASSPHLASESAALSPYPPFPLQTGGPPSTGTITDVQIDPSPIAALITSTPPAVTNQTSASFSFGASDTVATFRCGLDNTALTLCGGGTSQQYSGLSQGPHTFTVRAIDAAGRTSSASYQWTVRILPPSVAIRTPANTATYALGSKVTASYSCTAGPGSTVGSCSGPVANGSSIDTSRTGAHTFKVTAVDADGGTASSTVTYYVIRGPAGTGPGGAVKPVLRSVKETHRSWAVKKTSGHKKHKPPVGTTFTFTLNETASVTLTFSRHDPGRKVHKKCVAPTKKNRHAKSCTILTAEGAVVLNGHSGVNHVSFKGKTSRRTLKPGSYSVVISARSPGGTVSAKAMTFTIVSS